MAVAGAILAAGRSSRLGRPKQLLPLLGKPLLQHVLDAADASALGDIVLVLGHDAEAILQQIEPRRARVVTNRRYAEGQSSSVIAALDAVTEDAAGVMYLLGDQPAVTAALIDLLIQTFQKTNAMIVMPRYRDAPGNPVILASTLFPEIRRLSGDEGARRLIRAVPDGKVLVPVDGPAPADVDTETDYQQLLATWPPV